MAATSGILLSGSNNSITNSIVAYSAGDGILLLGRNNVASNNYIHDVDYSGADAAAVLAIGSGNVISHNTIRFAGRDGIQFSGSLKTQITNNLIYAVMQQTTDGGGIYAYGTDGTGSTIAYNQISGFHTGG